MLLNAHKVHSAKMKSQYRVRINRFREPENSMAMHILCMAQLAEAHILIEQEIWQVQLTT